MVNAIMHGCNGRMGQVITALAAEEEEFQIVAGVDITGEQKNGYPVFSSIEACDVQADVIIDFSSPKAFDGLLEYAVEKQLPVVVCTTGLSEEQTARLKEASGKTALLKSANMSLGVNVMIKLLKEAAKTLAPAGFDIEIVEHHHNKKKDAPSGTALALADSINEAMDGQYSYVYDRSGRREKRPQAEMMQPMRGSTTLS